MATSLSEAASKADRCAFTAYNGKTLRVGGLQNFVPDDAGADGNGGALVVIIRPLAELDGLERLSPDSECASASGASEEAELTSQ